jgi:AcrR family transcriptional regulator
MAPEERRAHLRDCAIRCFGATGFHATNVADIVKAAGVSQGTFYNYFDSKRAIFDDLLDGLLGEIKAAARPVRLGDGEPDPLQQLRENTERVLVLLLARADLTKLLLSEAVGLDVEADQKLLAFYGELLGLIEKALGWGQKLGLTRVGDPHLQARMVLGSVKEVVYQLVMARDEWAPGALAGALVDFNLRGLLGETARAALDRG